MPPIKIKGPGNEDETAPSTRIWSVTPADSDMEFAARQLRIGSIAGGTTLTVWDDRGNSVLFEGVQVGEILTGYFTRVMATGTTVSSIVAWG